MAWFSKPKDPEPVAPGLCARCHERTGSALVRFVAGPEAAPLDAAGRTASFCDSCLAALRREAAGN